MLCQTGDSRKESFLEIRINVVVVRKWLIHLSLKIPNSNLLIAGVSAIRRKLPGADGSSLVDLFGISLTAAAFQIETTLPSIVE